MSATNPFFGAIVFGVLISSSIAPAARALEACEPVVGRLVSAEGQVEVQRAAETRWQPATLDDVLCQGDLVRAGARSRAAIALINDAVLRLDQNTTLQLSDVAAAVEERSFLDLIVGAFQSFSRQPRVLAINTPYMNATIEGTEFVIRVAEAQSELTVFEGTVRAANPQGELLVASGESAIAEAGQAPQPRIVVRPRDAVQWALYYPPILAALGGRGVDAPPDLPPPLAEATALANQGDINGAFEVLDRVPAAERDAQHQTYRAALLLSVGRVDEAQAAIDQALASDPQAGLAYAQRSIIQLVHNEREQALADAERAVELSPEASAPRIALSYAQQGQFQLEAARDTLSQAVEQNPDDPLAWARLSELWLALGDRRQAREAAERAVALAPDLQRTQLVQGFANLVEFRTGAAKDAFGRAIALDPADPLPRLGLGLAQIREGDLEGGRGNLEVAVGLDANNALLRAYLGKAYFEERRNQLANDQYGLAQQLDPLDPTAYLYEAIKQQTENRPGEALQSLQRSIELNDNRAVYRSRQLLDADRAARGTSLARIYDDLGFAQLGLRESSRSLALDPANASAHRFLSDSYRSVRRREIARVSELLQAQMLQDININPVQPSLAETNLNIVTQGGPAEAGFNEFTPLFERQQAQINVSGLAGNNDTLGGEGVVSMLYDRYSLSAGAFGYTTDGWRDNHDIDHNIQNVFFQAALTPELNAQVELRRRHSEQGDLAFNFDPDAFLPNLERELDQKTARLGLRYSPAPHSDVLLSYIYSDREEQVTDSQLIEEFPDLGPFDLLIDSTVQDKGHQLEGQYLYQRDILSVTAGGSYNKVDREFEDFFDAGPFGTFEFPQDREIQAPRGYVYGNLNLPEPMTWTLGLSYDEYDEEEIEVNQVNPKFGVQWNVTPELVVRGAVTRTVKPPLVSNQTLEPTQVAGFNQFFDDPNATKSWRYGVGIDHRLLRNLFVGAEATWRKLDVPFLLLDEGRSVFEQQDEHHHRAYVNWLPIPELALSAEFVYDRFKADQGNFTDALNFPEDVKTFSVPLGARYFHPSGLFAGVSVTYVNQDVERSSESTLADAEGSSDFFVIDAAVGYRLPRRLGIASLSVANLTDEDFKYQDDSFREFQDAPSVGPYLPDRQIMGRLTLNF